MTDSTTIDRFLGLIKEGFDKASLLKITLGKTRKKDAELKNVFIRPILIGQQKFLSFIYHNKTNDITKNFALEEGLEQINTLLKDQFLQANLFDHHQDVQLMISKKRKVSLKLLKPSSPLLQTFSHDKIKKRLIDPDGKQYLQDLGITNQDFGVIPGMNSKFRQINKFIEIIDNTIPEKSSTNKFSVVDMGSGKGYLTFALYDHLTNNKKFTAEITGVEMRQELVDKCTLFARKSDFKKLNFFKSNIQDYSLEKTDMLIALHACDTATDDAIYKGITIGAEYILVAPCCHKQVRKSMNPDEILKPILRHGIYLERQAELLTDAIRGLILELQGYKIKTLEFVSTEHTPKNVMIIATKSGKTVDKVGISEQIKQIKKTFGIEYHQLELLLERN